MNMEKVCLGLMGILARSRDQNLMATPFDLYIENLLLEIVVISFVKGNLSIDSFTLTNRSLCQSCYN